METEKESLKERKHGWCDSSVLCRLNDGVCQHSFTVKHKSGFSFMISSCNEWPFYKLLTTTWLDMLQVITEAVYKRMSLPAPPVSPAHPHTHTGRYRQTALILCTLPVLWEHGKRVQERKDINSAENAKNSKPKLPVCHLWPVCCFLRLLSLRMKLLLVAAAAALLTVVRCASASLEDMEFHAWKLKFGESHRPLCSLTSYFGCNSNGSLLSRKVLQHSIRGGRTQASLAQQPQTGAGAQHPGRPRHQVLPPGHDSVCRHGAHV